MPLVFPSSDLPSSRDVPFRDGKRVVPGYLADLMVTLDTERYTYDEAVRMVNNRLTGEFVGAAYDRIISGHFKDQL